MENRDLDDIRRALRKLEARNRRLALALAIMAVLMMGTIAFAWHEGVFRKPDAAGGVLTVRELRVVDPHGVERVCIAAPLPDPINLGKRFPRGGGVSGILLFDDEGNERSGYVTSDGYPNVFFTLDSLERQHVLFIAEPQGDTTLRLWDGASVFNLSVGAEGPRLKLAGGDKAPFEWPAAEKTAAK